MTEKILGLLGDFLKNNNIEDLDLGQIVKNLPLDQIMAMIDAVSYTHLTLPTIAAECRSRWSPYH